MPVEFYEEQSGNAEQETIGTHGELNSNTDFDSYVKSVVVRGHICTSRAHSKLCKMNSFLRVIPKFRNCCGSFVFIKGNTLIIRLNEGYSLEYAMCRQLRLSTEPFCILT